MCDILEIIFNHPWIIHCDSRQHETRAFQKGDLDLRVYKNLKKKKNTRTYSIIESKCAADGFMPVWYLNRRWKIWHQNQNMHWNFKTCIQKLSKLSLRLNYYIISIILHFCIPGGSHLDLICEEFHDDFI